MLTINVSKCFYIIFYSLFPLFVAFIQTAYSESLFLFFYWIKANAHIVCFLSLSVVNIIEQRIVSSFKLPAVIRCNTICFSNFYYQQRSKTEINVVNNHLSRKMPIYFYRIFVLYHRIITALSFDVSYTQIKKPHNTS